MSVVEVAAVVAAVLDGGAGAGVVDTADGAVEDTSDAVDKAAVWTAVAVVVVGLEKETDKFL